MKFIGAVIIGILIGLFVSVKITESMQFKAVDEFRESVYKALDEVNDHRVTLNQDIEKIKKVDASIRKWVLENMPPDQNITGEWELNSTIMPTVVP